MPHNDSTVFMEKHIKHDSPAGGSNNNTNREAKTSSPVFLVPAKKNDSPLFKYQGQKWDHVFDFDKMLKQIRNAERYYLRGRDQNNGGKSGSFGNNARRIQPQVQRLNAGDMHFYGMVPKKPSNVVVCDICLGIYTKMGFNNHMRMHHAQAWHSVSSKASIPTASTSKDAVYHSSSGGNSSHNDNQELKREISASGNPLAESTANATPTVTSSANNSRHKSSKSGSCGGSSRSRSKNKHHHHHHQTSSSLSSTAAAAASSASSSVSAATSSAIAAQTVAQAAASNTEVPSSHVNTSGSSKNSKKGTSPLSSSNANSSYFDKKLNITVAVPKEEAVNAVQPISLLGKSSKSSNVEITTALPTTTPIPSLKVAKEKTKASKRKSKNSSTAAPAPAYTTSEPPNESSNSSNDLPSIASNTYATTTNSKSSKRSSKAKGGKDLKQLLEPQLSELDQAVSSITSGQMDVITDNTNSNDLRDVVPVDNSVTNSILSFNATNGNSLHLPMQATATRQIMQQAQQSQPQFNNMQIIQDGNLNMQQQQSQLQQQNSNDNDSSMLTLDDIDTKFIHEILNTDVSEIHFDESELDKATAGQQQAHPGYLQQTIPSKRMRYDERMTTTNLVAQQPSITGNYAAFQHQQQHQVQPPFHVTNMDDIKMYTTEIGAQEYLSAQPSQHQQQQQQDHTHNNITTIDTLQLQQLLYQQQQHQGLNAYSVDNLNATANTLEQQQYNNADVIMCSAEQLHKEGKINAADYATLTALSNNDAYGSVPNSICNVNSASAASAAAAQFQVYNIPSLTDDDIMPASDMMDDKMNNVIIPQNHYVLPGDSNEEEQLIYEITANNQVALISQQRQQQMIAEFLTQAGYDNMENVNMNINDNGSTVLAAEPIETKLTITDVDLTDDLLDFDFSRLETVTSVSSSSSLSTENKANIKTETQSDKYVSTAALPDDMFLNVHMYAGMPRPLALNSFGLVKLPQSVATTFRKNLHATRKANNSPVYSLSGGSGSPAVTTRFGSNASNAKSSAAQSYFTALGTNAVSGGFFEFSNIGSITINNQASTLQQQLPANQKPNLHNDFSFNVTNSNVNGLITSAAASAVSPTPPTTGSLRAGQSRPRSGSSTSSGATGTSSAQSKIKQCSNSSFQMPQSQPKTIFVNTNLGATASNADKFIKRSLIAKASPTLHNGSTLTSKQLSDILLHPSKDSKEKYLQLLNPRDQDKDDAIEHQQQRLENVKSFYERRKRLMNATAQVASTKSGYYHAHQLNRSQLNGSSSSPAALKQKLLRERLLRTLSDCGINSIKSNSSSPNSNSGNDILRVLA